MREAYSPVFEINNPILLLSFIFANNAAKLLLMILAGVFFGLIPVIFIFLNGFVIGAVIYEASQLRGSSFVLAAILPHGIIEIPTAIMCGTIGLEIGYQAILWFRGQSQIRVRLKSGLRVFAFRFAPFLFVAAFIETFITPIIVGLV